MKRVLDTWWSAWTTLVINLHLVESPHYSMLNQPHVCPSQCASSNASRNLPRAITPEWEKCKL